jgi:hypothetical protein
MSNHEIEDGGFAEGGGTPSELDARERTYLRNKLRELVDNVCLSPAVIAAEMTEFAREVQS